MKLQTLLCTVIVSAAASAGFAQTAPTDVAFVDGAVEQSLTGVPGDPVAGEAIATTASLGNCVACHQASVLEKYEFPGNVGPTLDGAADRWEPAQLRGLVINAKTMFDGTIMPSFYKTGPYIRPGDAYTGKAAEGELPPLLTAQQVEDVVAFLATLKE
jgi:sulfur-oxidizing protein SoxX